MVVSISYGAIFIRVQRNEWLYKFTSLPADKQGIKYKEFEDESVDIGEGCRSAAFTPFAQSGTHAGCESACRRQAPQ